MKTIQRKSSACVILKKIMFALLIGILIMQISSCKNDKKGEQVLLTVRMTDAPANYDAVTIDVQGVEIIGDDGNKVMLTNTPGLYNLLDLSNGINTILATGYVKTGKVSQVRLS